MSEEDRKRAATLHALAVVIRKRRQQLNLSMTQLGERCGLSQQSISYVEREKRCPSAETLFRLAAALEIELSELIKRAENSSSS